MFAILKITNILNTQIFNFKNIQKYVKFYNKQQPKQIIDKQVIETVNQYQNTVIIDNENPRALLQVAQGKHLSAGTQYINIGSQVPEHFHPDQEEILFCTSGEGEIYVNGEKRRFIPGVMVYVPQGIKHQIVNISKTTELCLTWTLSPPSEIKQFQADKS